MAQNLVESARVYDLMTRTFYTELVGPGLSKGMFGYKSSEFMNRNAEKGAFGRIPAVYDVTEAQGRGGIHSRRAQTIGGEHVSVVLVTC